MRHNSYRILLEKYTMEDIKKFHLDVPIEILSNGACTADGILKRTAGMDTQTLRKKYPMMQCITDEGIALAMPDSGMHQIQYAITN